MTTTLDAAALRLTDQRPDNEKKLEQLRALSDAITEIKRTKKHGAKRALALQQLERQRATIRRTMPLRRL